MKDELRLDLVCFDLAVLLKEKGFNEHCLNTFNKDLNDVWVEEIWKDNVVKDLIDSDRNYAHKNVDDLEECYYIIFDNDDDSRLARPTLYLAQKWLNLKHKLRVFVEPSSQGIFKYSIRKWNYDNVIGKWESISHPTSFNTNEEALEKGIEEAANLIKTNHEK